MNFRVYALKFHELQQVISICRILSRTLYIKKYGHFRTIIKKNNAKLRAIAFALLGVK